MINLPKEWKEKYWHSEEDAFTGLFKLDGQVFKEKDGRRTLRFELEKKHYFGKFHKGVGWKKILKNLLQFRRPPVLSAQNEWKAIQKLDSIGINTMHLVGYGKRGKNPAKVQSFVITDELKDTISLENYCKNWSLEPPPEKIKKALIIKIAQIARTIHENGLNHRDLYICHFLLDLSNLDLSDIDLSDIDLSDIDLSEGVDEHNLENLRLFLIDLHRVQIRKSTPWRWRVKDISALMFSSMDIGLTKEDLLLFARYYHNTTARKSISENKIFWWIVKRRAIGLYKKQFNKKPPALGKLYG